MQETISLLASEGGLKIIGELVNERSFETMSNQALVRIFEAQFIPFFQTLCLKNVVASAMLEERRATICSYLFGVDGVRATVVFAAAVRYLSLMEKPSDTDANDASTLRYHATWESSLQMFATLIATKSAAHISEGIRKVVAKLSECVAAAPVPLSRAAMKQFTRVERMTARTLANVKEKTDRERAVKPTFTLAREQPGDLSQDGPRHDNDSKDIREIQIMPTLAEIQSARAEYLPGMYQTSKPNLPYTEVIAANASSALCIETDHDCERDANDPFSICRIRSSGMARERSDRTFGSPFPPPARGHHWSTSRRGQNRIR